MNATHASLLLLPFLLSACSSAPSSSPRPGETGAHETGIRIESPLDATEVRLVSPDGSSTRIAANTLIEVPAGEYRVTHSTQIDFVFAERLTVNAHAVTTLSLGALDLRTLPGATSAEWRVHDPSDDRILVPLQGANEAVAVPAGIYRLKDAFAQDFVYAEAVAVQAGSVSVVPMGAIRISGSDADCSSVRLFPAHAAIGAVALRANDRSNELLTVPPGAFQIRDELHKDEFVYFDEVVVAAGQVTERTLGSFAGPAENFDIYDASCQTRLASFNSPNRAIAAPLGSYCLKRYYTETVIGQVVAQ